MADALRELMLRTAMDAGRQHERPCVGIVTSYDPSRYAVKVRLQPSGDETGWLPILAEWGGPGWGLFTPPSQGDEVSVFFQEGGREAGYAKGRFFSTSVAPQAVNSGEFWLVHQSGAWLKFTNDGKVSMNSTAEIDIGNVGATLHQLVTDAFVALFNGHVHGNGNGGGNTTAPTTTMGAAHLTSVLKAN